LAERYPASKESLLFFAELSELQGSGAGIAAFQELVSGLHAPEDWFDRVLGEMREPVTPETRTENECPQCGAPPQLGVLRPQGDGAAMHLSCALCRHEWTYPRSRCPGCGDGSQLEYYSAAEAFPAVLTLVCGACKAYLHVVDISKDPEAVPEADEIAVQPMDMWAREQGYQKVAVNLVGV
jgi:formate dehydrogenase accessory protein FdhE